MNSLYNITIGLYDCAIRIAALRSNKVHTMLHGELSTFEYLSANIKPDDRIIWIHASSLGEFEQGRPLIEAIKRDYPGRKILLTFFSPSGYEVRKNYSEADYICYLPLDTPRNARRFVELAHPQMAIFVKYEFWGNYLQNLRHANIPTYIISAIFRKSQAFFKPWGGMFRKMLRCFTTIFVQDENSKQLLNGIRINNVIVAGDTRFDRVTDIQRTLKSFPAIENFASQKPTIIMGSSWEPDEEIVFAWISQHPEWNIIVAPHVINPDRIAKIEERLHRRTVRHSSLSDDATQIDGDALIIDCFGILSSCYTYATVAWIGGGFGAGIHNINEAAVYGIPVMFGPNHHKFKEAQDLIAAGGGFEITSLEQFDKLMQQFIESPGRLKAAGNASKEYILKNLGATKRILSELSSSI